MNFQQLVLTVALAVSALAANSPAKVVQEGSGSNTTALPQAQQPQQQAAPAQNAAAQNTQADPQMTEIVQTLEAENLFALKMTAAISATDEPDFVISPYGVFESLNFLKAGVTGSADDEIAVALGLVPDRVYAEELGRIRMSHLPPTPPATGQQTPPPVALSPFVTQNVFLYDSGLAVTDATKANIFTPFRTAAGPVNWSDPASAESTAQDVSRLFAEATSNRLTELNFQAPQEQNLKACLVNLCYFEAAWLEPFSESATVTGPFTRADGTQINADFMNESALQTRYLESPSFKLMELNYQRTGMTMVFVLPAPGISDQQVIRDLSTSGAVGVRANRPQAVTNIRIQIPKFEFKSLGIDLRSICQTMGIQSLFQPGCGLEEIFEASEELFVGYMKQNAFIRVDEKGTEAAAITESGIVIMSAPPSNPEAEFVADRPFLFFIVDNNGGIYFSGRVGNPESTAAAAGSDKR